MDWGGGVCLPGNMKSPLEADDHEWKVISTTIGVKFSSMQLCLCRHEETGVCV